MKLRKDIPAVDDAILKHPYVEYLHGILEAQSVKLDELSKKVEELEAEIRRLKKLPKKPNIQPSKLDEDSPDGTQSKEKHPKIWSKDKKRSKLEIHEHKEIKASRVPAGWRLVGYESRIREDIIVRANNIEYRLEIWQSPDGSQRIVAELPAHLQGTHFGGTLKAYILHLYYECCVTQPLILSSLRDFGVQISSGQLSAILTEDKEVFHEEKAGLLSKAIELGVELRTDDTGARHGFKNASCNCINSDLFTHFSTTTSKSRINFLEILRGQRTDYHLNDAAFSYLEKEELVDKYLAILRADYELGKTAFANETQLDAYLSDCGFTAAYAIKKIKEALLIGCLVEYGFDQETRIHSDGAGQFNLFIHSLCWKHSERPLLKLKCYNPIQEQLYKEKLTAFWGLYRRLCEYKEAPSQQQATELSAAFDQLCSQVDRFAALNQVLESLAVKKDQLLVVLKYPQTSLHNNYSESDIREYVKRRKISAGTRSENGKRARDTFLSLKKTCRKLGISFWEYLQDRIMNLGQIPTLPTLMEQKALLN